MSSGSKNDPAWQYCTRIEGNKNGTICTFCGDIMQSGGITRFKYHLTGIESHKNVRTCPNVPPEVKNAITQWLKNKEKAKQKKAAMFEDIQQELRGESRESEYEEEDDVYMYPKDLHPDEREAYINAVQASKASEFEREQQERVFRGKSKRGEGSGASGGSQSSQLRRTKSVQEPNPKPPIAPSFYKSSGARQKSLKDMLLGGSIREKMGRLVSKFFIYDNVAPS